jgi:HPt (histidine-containing phosphotransfer) domain-containing protein
MLYILYATTPDSLDEIERSREAGDPDAIRRAAHSLKGSCQNVGATAMATVCHELEADPAIADAGVERLRELVEPTLAALRGVAA